MTKPFVNHTLKKSQKIIVSNPNLIKSSPYLQKFEEKCEVVPFGVDFKEIENNLNEKEVGKIKERYGNFVLFVGRLNYYKGTKYLIEAMKDVRANLVIIGEGPELANYKLQITNYKLEDRTYFLPHLSEKELINFYRACSVFVLPSIFRSEAFGIVLIEAMACGAPVISTELGTGTSWVNVNNKTGFVVLPRDSLALAQAIKKILGNKKMAQGFSQNALKKARKEFSLEGMLKKTEKAYKNLFLRYKNSAKKFINTLVRI